MSRLSELLTAASTAAGLSGRAISRRAQELGLPLNHDTAARYLRGDHGRPDETTLVALSTVLDLPLADLRRAAALPPGETAPYQPPAEANRLTRRQRQAVDEIIRAMLEPAPTRESGAQRAGRPPRRARPADEPPSLKLAARRGDVEAEPQ